MEDFSDVRSSDVNEEPKKHTSSKKDKEKKSKKEKKQKNKKQKTSTGSSEEEQHKSKPSSKKKKARSDNEEESHTKKKQKNKESYHNKENESARSKPDIYDIDGDNDSADEFNDDLNAQTIHEQEEQRISEEMDDQEPIENQDQDDEDFQNKGTDDEKTKEDDESDSYTQKGTKSQKGTVFDDDVADADGQTDEESLYDELREEMYGKETDDQEGEPESAIPNETNDKDYAEFTSTEPESSNQNPGSIPYRNTYYEKSASYYGARFTEAKKTFKVLHDAFFHSNGEITVSKEDVIKYLEGLEEFWSLRKDADPYDTNEKIILARINMGLAARGNVSPDEIERAISRNIHFTLSVLEHRFVQHGLLQNGSKESAIYEERFKRLYDLIHSMVWMVYHDSRTTFRLENHEKSLNASISMLQWEPKTSLENAKRHQKFLVYVMRKLEEGDYRRYGEDVYKAIWTAVDEEHPISYFTNAWEKKCSVQEFVDSCCSENINFETFLDMTAVLGTRTQVATFLTYFQSPSFPDLEQCRYMLSFKNGILHIDKGIFIKYSEKHKIVDSDMDSDIPRIDIKKRNSKDKGLFGLSSKYVSASYIDLDFEDMTVQALENPLNIPTTAMDSVLNWQIQGYTQEQQDQIKGTYYGLLGRSLFWGGEHDRWEVALLTLGKGGTGKTTIYNTVMNIYARDNLGIISNNAETQWALSSLYGDEKYSTWGTEIGDNFKWAQTEFQQCVSLEYVSVAKKHMTAFTYPWRSHIFLAGNKFPDSWRNEGDNLKRRLAIFNYDEYVPKGQSDPQLPNKLYLELPFIIQKILGCYKYLVRTCGNANFWSWCDPYFKARSDECFAEIHPLMQFLKPSEGRVDYVQIDCEVDEYKEEEVDGELKNVKTGKKTVIRMKPFCSKDDFVFAFSKYLKIRGDTFKTKNFTRKYYEDIFKQNDAGQIVTLRSPEDWENVFEKFKNANIKIKNEQDWQNAGLPVNMCPKFGQEYFYGVTAFSNFAETSHVNPQTQNSKKRGAVVDRDPSNESQ